MKARTNAYDRMKSKSKKGNDFSSMLKKEETYFIGAAFPAMLLAGVFDGGISVAIAYGARKLYEANNG